MLNISIKKEYEHSPFLGLKLGSSQVDVQWCLLEEVGEGGGVNLTSFRRGWGDLSKFLKIMKW